MMATCVAFVVLYILAGDMGIPLSERGIHGGRKVYYYIVGECVDSNLGNESIIMT